MTHSIQVVCFDDQGLILKWISKIWRVILQSASYVYVKCEFPLSLIIIFWKFNFFCTLLGYYHKTENVIFFLNDFNGILFIVLQMTILASTVFDRNIWWSTYKLSCCQIYGYTSNMFKMTNTRIFDGSFGHVPLGYFSCSFSFEYTAKADWKLWYRIYSIERAPSNTYT